MEFDTVIYFKIIDCDISLVNSFVRTCKKLNRQILSNNILMHKVSLFYIPNIKKMIDQHIKIVFALPITDKTQDMIYNMYLVNENTVTVRKMSFTDTLLSIKNLDALLQNQCNKDNIKKVDDCFELYLTAIKFRKDYFPYEIDLNNTINLYKNFKFILKYIESEHNMFTKTNIFTKTYCFVQKHSDEIIGVGIWIGLVGCVILASYSIKRCMK